MDVGPLRIMWRTCLPTFERITGNFISMMSQLQTSVAPRVKKAKQRDNRNLGVANRSNRWWHCHVQDKLLSRTSMGQVATIYGTSQRRHLLWHLRQMLLRWWHHFYTNTLTNHPLFNSCRHHTPLKNLSDGDLSECIRSVFIHKKRNGM